MTEERIFLIVLIINLLVALIYLIWGVLLVTVRRRKRKEPEEFLRDNRRTYLLRFLVMLLCPVIGPLFFFISFLLYITIFRFQVDLEDVVFSKERVRIQLRADEERERNIVPIEEAIAVNEKRNLRMAMMNIVKGDIQDSLASIALALNTKDSESSHYAASILSDELNVFRVNVQKLYQEMQEESDTEILCEETLLQYMDRILRQRVFSDMEQKKYVAMMEETGERFYSKAKEALTQEQLENLCVRLLEINDFGKAEKWSLRLAEKYADSLPAYTCKLKLYFAMKNRDAFFQTLDALKKSDVVIDSETLELIHMFS